MLVLCFIFNVFCDEYFEKLMDFCPNFKAGYFRYRKAPARERPGLFICWHFSQLAAIAQRRVGSTSLSLACMDSTAFSVVSQSMQPSVTDWP